MDPAILSATSALIGSLIGGLSTFSASWVTQRRLLRSHLLIQQAEKRETLYADFIAEAAKRLTEAWSTQPKEPAVLADLYATTERLRLISSNAVMVAAEHILRRIVEAYGGPNRTFDDLRKGLIGGDVHPDDPFKEFTDACKAELRALHI